MAFSALHSCLWALYHLVPPCSLHRGQLGPFSSFPWALVLSARSPGLACALLRGCWHAQSQITPWPQGCVEPEGVANLVTPWAAGLQVPLTPVNRPLPGVPGSPLLVFSGTLPLPSFPRGSRQLLGRPRPTACSCPCRGRRVSCRLPPKPFRSFHRLWERLLSLLCFLFLFLFGASSPGNAQLTPLDSGHSWQAGTGPRSVTCKASAFLLCCLCHSQAPWIRGPGQGPRGARAHCSA